MTLKLCVGCIKENKLYLGKVVYLSKGRGKGLDQQTVDRHRKQGWTIDKIAQEYGVTDRRVYQIQQQRDKP
jgi:hypothetical protein